jgi:hypothetical protein
VYNFPFPSQGRGLKGQGKAPLLSDAHDDDSMSNNYAVVRAPPITTVLLVRFVNLFSATTL